MFALSMDNKNTAVYLRHIGVFDMRTLENRGENGQCSQFAGTAEHHDRKLSCLQKAFLLWRLDHPTAIVAPVHGGSQPDVLICMLHAVHCDNGGSGLIVKQKALYGNGGVVDRLCGNCPLSVTFQAAITVDAVYHFEPSEVSYQPTLFRLDF